MFPHVIRAAGVAVFLLASLCGAIAQTTDAPTTPAPVQNLPKEEASGVLGHDVRAADGRDMGRIIDVVVDHNGQPRAAVIDFGGFLGVGSRKIAVDWAMLHFTPGKPDVPVTLDLTPDQLKATPEYSATATTASAVAVAPDAAAAPASAAKP